MKKPHEMTEDDIKDYEWPMMSFPESVIWDQNTAPSMGRLPRLFYNRAEVCCNAFMGMTNEEVAGTDVFTLREERNALEAKLAASEQALAKALGHAEEAKMEAAAARREVVIVGAKNERV